MIRGIVAVVFRSRLLSEPLPQNGEASSGRRRRPRPGPRARRREPPCSRPVADRRTPSVGDRSGGTIADRRSSSPPRLGAVTIDGALPVLEIDGSRFDDLSGFAREFSRLLCGHHWNGNLDALNDILRGGFGTPEDGFTLRWVNSEASRRALGWEATVKWLEQKLLTCHASSRTSVEQELAAARLQEGNTLFDWIVEVVRVHGPGGNEADDNVRLELA